MTEKLVETIAIFTTGAFTALIALLVYALTSYFLSAREYNRETARLFKNILDAKESEEELS